MGSQQASIVWSSQFSALPQAVPSLPGDKILLPQSALEQLLAKAPKVEIDQPNDSYTRSSTFDPYNPYTFSAERNARSATRQQSEQLPHPLTFRLVNSNNGRVVYAGIREFSAEEGHIGLSTYLWQTLGLSEDREESTETGKNRAGDDVFITVHFQQLEKGTFVKLRPLEAGYHPEDWKSLLEEYLRKNFTTLTKGEMLRIPGARSFDGTKEDFEFLIDEFKPEADAVCIVDTDLEVDIEALNEEQARETVRMLQEKLTRTSTTTYGSSTGGKLDLFKEQSGQVAPGDYVDYELPSWDRSQGVQIELNPVSVEESDIYLFLSPFGSRQRSKPRVDEHVAADFESRPSKRIRISPTNVEMESADALWVSIFAPDASHESKTPQKYTLKASPYDPSVAQADAQLNGNKAAGPDETRCNNCKQLVPKQSILLHENFCRRNNVLCPQGCGQVFQKKSESFDQHWHCPHDSSFGNTPISFENHNIIYHKQQQCPSCSHPPFQSIPALAQHRTTTCPGKLILCRFCHLVVPQDDNASGTDIDDSMPDATLALTGLTPHEAADGARTTDCYLCSRRIRLRDMDAHLKNHDMERKNRFTPRVCRNLNCGRTLDGTSSDGKTRVVGSSPSTGNELGLCGVCYGPLYVTMYDPDGKALQRRVERRYLTQLTKGCDKLWCRNEYCKTGRTARAKNQGVDVPPSLTLKDALPLVKPFVSNLPDTSSPLHFCVDENSQQRRALAELISAEGNRIPGQKSYSLPWCIGALEGAAGKLDQARDWLANFAPTEQEEAG